MKRPLTALALLAGASCAGTPPVTKAPTAEEVRQLLLKGPGSNIAVTNEAWSPPLRPLTVPGTPLTVRHLIGDAIGRLPRWRIVDENDAVVWATHTTRIFRFVDDVYLLMTPVGDSVRLEARSASRLGKGDLGQNRRNLTELLTELRKPR